MWNGICSGDDGNIYNNLIYKIKHLPINGEKYSIIESIILVPKYGDTLPEYSGAVGIMKYYNDHNNPLPDVILDQALNSKEPIKKFNQDFSKYNLFIKKQENDYLKEISEICAKIGYNKITNNAALALYLYGQNKKLSEMVNVYFKHFLLNGKVDNIRPTSTIMVECVDNNVPFILYFDKKTYLCIGYMETTTELNLIVADMNEITARKYNGLIEGLEKTKKMKDKKLAEYWRKHYEVKIKEGAKVIIYIDYIFGLKTASDKSYIKTIKWQPSSDQSMTIIYPPKCDKPALRKCLE